MTPARTERALAPPPIAAAGRRGRGRLAAFALHWFVALVFVAGVSSHAAIFSWRPELVPITSDGYDYYVYLPAWFLYHDATLQRVADDCCGGSFPETAAITRRPGTSRWVNAHSIGVAVLTAPFFGLAHGLTLWSGLPPDGFSLFYQHAAALAGLAYMLAGLATLRALLLRRGVSTGVTLATLTALTFGTNLFHYGVFDATYSHAFSFGLVCALMALADRWWESPSWPTSLAIGGLAGLIVLVRQANVLLLAIVPLAGLASWSDAPSRLTAILATDRLRKLSAAAALAVLLFLPQLLLYRQATGAWVLNPYSGGSFAYKWAPRIFGVLFSVQKGLFFWSPVLLLAVPGAWCAKSWARGWRIAFVVILAAQAYLLASWHDWQLGGSYGHRGFTDALGLFAPLLASCFAWSAGRPRVRRVVSVAAGLAVLLSIIQMWQYWLGIVPIADTSWAQYKALLLRFR